MATKYWVGGATTYTDSGRSTTDNPAEIALDEPQNWEGGVAPVDGDTIVFDGRANLVTSAASDWDGQTYGDMWSPASYLDGLTGTTTGYTIIVTEDFTGNIGWLNGSTYESMELGVKNAYIQGTGSYYIKNTKSGATLKCTAAAAVRISNDTTGDWDIVASAGTINGDGTLDILSIVGTGASFQLEGGTVASLVLNDGTIITDADITAAVIAGGTLEIGSSSSDPTASVDITGLEMYAGLININTTHTLTEAALYGGEISAKTADAITLGAASKHISVYGGTFDMSGAGYDQVNMGDTTSRVKNLGAGVIKAPPGSEAVW